MLLTTLIFKLGIYTYCSLANIQFNYFQRCVILSVLKVITTQAQFNVLSGSLIECLEKPRHVGVSLYTNIGKNNSNRVIITWATIYTGSMIWSSSTCISPNMFAWCVAICDGYSTNISIINGQRSVNMVSIKCSCCTKLVSQYLSTHLGVLN